LQGKFLVSQKSVKLISKDAKNTEYLNRRQ